MGGNRGFVQGNCWIYGRRAVFRGFVQGEGVFCGWRVKGGTKSHSLFAIVNQLSFLRVAQKAN